MDRSFEQSEVLCLNSDTLPREPRGESGFSELGDVSLSERRPWSQVSKRKKCGSRQGPGRGNGESEGPKVWMCTALTWGQGAGGKMAEVQPGGDGPGTPGDFCPKE